MVGGSIADYVTFWSMLIVAPYGVVCRREACGGGGGALGPRRLSVAARRETSSDRIKGYSYTDINTLYVKNYRVDVTCLSG